MQYPLLRLSIEFYWIFLTDGQAVPRLDAIKMYRFCYRLTKMGSGVWRAPAF